MKIRSIAQTAAAVMCAAILTGCKNSGKKLAQPVEKQAKVIIKESVPKNYANLKVYCGFEPMYDLKVENGVSFITDNTRFSAINGEFQGELLNIKDDIGAISTKFAVGDKRDFSLPVIKTIKMLAGFTDENVSNSALTLSKADIASAKSKLKCGSIWNDAKHFFVNEGASYLRFGKIKHTKGSQGIKFDIYDRDYKLCDMQFDAK